MATKKSEKNSGKKEEKRVVKTGWESLAERYNPKTQWGKFYAEVKKKEYFGDKKGFFNWCKEKGYC